MRRISLKQQILCRTAMDPDTAPANPEEPPADGDTTIQHLPEDCLVELPPSIKTSPCPLRTNLIQIPLKLRPRRQDRLL